jgi:tRNA threonylcarbamoyladenosine biosynthesis protein TsaB
VRILAFDTATRATAVALLDEAAGIELELRDDPAPGRRPGHTARLMPLIAEVLGQAGYGWPDVDLLAVGTGPGTFTGLRIGVATARALARARDLPLVGVSTLQSLAVAAADTARRAEHDAVLAVLDARRREVFSAAWPIDPPHGDAILDPRAMSPAALAEAATELGSSRLAVGDGAVEFRAVLERPGTVIPADDSELHRVSAVVHCRLAAQLPSHDSGAVAPEYLRRPDAELTIRARS